MRNRLLILLIFSLFVFSFVPPANTATGSDSPELVVVDVRYATREELSYLSTHYDLWQVNPQESTAKLMISQKEFAELSELGFEITLDEQNTILVNSGWEMLPGQRAGVPGLPCYRTVDEIFADAETLATSHPTLAQWVDIGDSWEKMQYGAGYGHDIRVLELSNQKMGWEKAKILINSGLHARELAPVELNMRLAEYLVDHYGLDADITWLLDYNEVHLLLVSNPDGRVQVENTGFLWRKNTNENYCGPTSTSRGADLNRNFDFHWDGGYSSTNPCDPSYRGPSPLSEPESQAISSYELALFEDQRGPEDDDPAPLDTTGMFIDLHSYGNLVLWPYGFDFTSTAPNNTPLQTLGRKLAYFNQYAPIQANVLYPASGATDDFAYGTLGIASYTIEMGSEFFQDCTTFESTIYPDNLDALIYALKSARRPYQTPAGPDVLTISVPAGQLPFNQSFVVGAELDDTFYWTSNGYEPTQNIQVVRASIDTPPWDAGQLFALQAVDGTFDEKNEAVSGTISTIGLVGGRHTLFVQGQDAAGNWGAVSAVFFETEYGYYFPLSFR